MLSFKDQHYKKTLEKHVELEDKLLHLFTKDEIDSERIYEVVKELNNLRKKKLQIKNGLANARLKLEPTLIDAYNIFLKEIYTIQEKLSKDEIPSLDIKNITNFIDVFSEFLKISQNEISIFEYLKDTQKETINTDDVNGKIIVLSSDNEKIPLKFKNGRKILLTTNNFDVSLFTHDELIELLRLLDIVISDNKYDILRSEISKQISTISTISRLTN